MDCLISPVQMVLGSTGATGAHQEADDQAIKDVARAYDVRAQMTGADACGTRSLKSPIYTRLPATSTLLHQSQPNVNQSDVQDIQSVIC